MRFVLVGLLLFFVFTAPAAGQSTFEFAFGAQAGLPFTVPLTSSLTGPAGSFSSQAFSRPGASGGPTIAVTIKDRVTVQFDALYKRMKFTSSYFNGTSWVSSGSTRVSSWEFPLIADYTIPARSMRPFAGGGILLGQKLSGTSEGQLPAYVINGGLEWRPFHFALRPELRYTRWTPVSYSTAQARREKQLEYLVGFAFRASK